MAATYGGHLSQPRRVDAQPETVCELIPLHLRHTASVYGLVFFSFAAVVRAFLQQGVYVLLLTSPRFQHSFVFDPATAVPYVLPS